jgi:hypothetical protein
MELADTSSDVPQRQTCMVLRKMRSALSGYTAQLDKKDLSPACAVWEVCVFI